MLHRFEICTMIKNYLINIPCYSEAMARELLIYFQEHDGYAGQVTTCYDNQENLNIVAFFDKYGEEQ
jgi:hypothetical protein